MATSQTFHVLKDRSFMGNDYLIVIWEGCPADDFIHKLVRVYKYLSSTAPGDEEKVINVYRNEELHNQLALYAGCAVTVTYSLHLQLFANSKPIE